MTKKLACRLGRHDWTTRVEGGESYKVCAACWKTPSESAYSGSGKAQQGPAREGDAGMDESVVVAPGVPAPDRLPPKFSQDEAVHLRY